MLNIVAIKNVDLLHNWTWEKCHRKRKKLDKLLKRVGVLFMKSLHGMSNSPSIVFIVQERFALER